MASFSTLALCLLSICTFSQAATVKLAIEVAWSTVAPDGFSRQGITVNGQMPGPSLILDQGDHVEFLVKNRMNESTSVHFHGITQHNTPWSDGVAGLAQKPIPPGGEFLYTWTANDYGTYWYHGHYQTQIEDGLFGAIYINPAPTQKRPFSMISSNPDDIAMMMAAERSPNLVMVNDWLHVTSNRLSRIANATNLEMYCTQSILINGKGRVHCLSPKEQKLSLAPPLAAEYNGTLEPSGCVPFSPLTEGMNVTLHLENLPKDLIYGCSATESPESEFTVDPSLGWASFHFINAANVINNVMSIDEHPMWVYAVDGRYIVPQKVEGLTNANGNRYSVMVKLDKPDGIFTMRASNFGLNQLISGFASVKYSTTSSTAKVAPSKPYFSYGGFPLSPKFTQLNDVSIHSIVPFENEPPAKHADQTVLLFISRLNPPYLYTLEGGTPYPSFPVEYSETKPMLYFPESANANNSALVIKTKNDTWVDLVMITTDLGGPSHPMHKHSNKAYMIGQGIGKWNWSTVAEASAAQPKSFNFVNPPLRDGFATLQSIGPPTWTVIRYHVVNPGAFLFHCHIQVHLTGGMAVALLDGADVLPDLEVPSNYGPNGNGLIGDAFQSFVGKNRDHAPAPSAGHVHGVSLLPAVTLFVILSVSLCFF